MFPWVVLIFVFPLMGLAFELGNILSLKYADISKKYLQTVVLPNSFVPPLKAIIYGNKRYGYFRIEEFTVTGQTIVIPIVPPGYQTPIEFYFESNSNNRTQWIYKTKKRFENPTPSLFNYLKGKSNNGEFSSNYFLINGHIENVSISPDVLKGQQLIKFNRQANQYRPFHFVFVLNRYNEIVWSHVPQNFETEEVTEVLIAKPTGPGRFGILAQSQRAYFEEVNYRGDIISSLLSPLSRKINTHHDFHSHGDGRILALGSEKVSLNAFGWLNAVSGIYKGSLIQEIDLKSHRIHVLWRWWQHLTPLKEPHWVANRNKKGSGSEGFFDFDHANAMQYLPGEGYLLTFRNLSRVCLLSVDLKKFIWCLGGEDSSYLRFQYERDRFHRPHQGTLLKNGHLLVFDNGNAHRGSRCLEFKLDFHRKLALLVRSYQPPRKIFSKTRGSAVEMPSGNILVNFPVNKRGLFGSSDLFEFDRSSTKVVAQMRMASHYIQPWYRIYPLSTIGTEIHMKDFSWPE